MYNYKDIWNHVRSVVGETLNCEHEVKNPHGSLCGWFMEIWHNHVLHVISHLHVIFLIPRHSGVFESTDGPQARQ